MAFHSFAAGRKLIRALEKRSQPICCGEGCILFSQGDQPRGLYILKTGEALLIMNSASGHMIMCHRVFAGSVLGLSGVIGNEPHTLGAIARGGSKVGFVSRLDFEDLIREYPSLQPNLLEILASDVRGARQAFFEHSTG